jgi:hypothetical protein
MTTKIRGYGACHRSYPVAAADTARLRFGSEPSSLALSLTSDFGSDSGRRGGKESLLAGHSIWRPATLFDDF